MKLFGTDGVRGKAGAQLDATKAMRLAMAAGIYFRKNSKTNKIIIGKDTRRSGYMIETAIVAGLTAVGYNVRQIGPMPTPAVAFLTEDMRCDGGIMISASHNPYYDNGIKFFDHTGNKLNEKAEAAIEKIYHNDSLIAKNQKQELEIGSAKRVDDVIGRYIVQIKNSFPKSLTLSGIRVVLDVAHGAAYKVAPTIFNELGAETIVIANDPNGSNINLNCGALHPEALSEQVKMLRADIGFGFDGDADRLVVVDEHGKVVHGDMLLGALALFLKQSHALKGDAIVATVMSNKALEDFLHSHQIGVMRCDVGDKYVLETLRTNGLNFGGEQSGHIIFGDFAKTGDALVAAMQVMAYMLISKKKASTLLSPFELYPQLLRNVSVGVKKPLESIPGYDKEIQILQNARIRPLIRYSGTEALLRILLEGEDGETLQTHMEKLEEFFQKALHA